MKKKPLRKGGVGNSLEEKVDPRFHIRNPILDRRQQELPDVRLKDRGEPNNVLPSQKHLTEAGNKTGKPHPSNGKRFPKLLPNL